MDPIQSTPGLQLAFNDIEYLLYAKTKNYLTDLFNRQPTHSEILGILREIYKSPTAQLQLSTIYNPMMTGTGASSQMTINTNANASMMTGIGASLPMTINTNANASMMTGIGASPPMTSNTNANAVMMTGTGALPQVTSGTGQGLFDEGGRRIHTGDGHSVHGDCGSFFIRNGGHDFCIIL